MYLLFRHIGKAHTRERRNTEQLKFMYLCMNVQSCVLVVSLQACTPTWKIINLYRSLIEPVKEPLKEPFKLLSPMIL